MRGLLGQELSFYNRQLDANCVGNVKGKVDGEYIVQVTEIELLGEERPRRFALLNLDRIFVKQEDVL